MSQRDLVFRLNFNRFVVFHNPAITFLIRGYFFNNYNAHIVFFIMNNYICTKPSLYGPTTLYGTIIQDDLSDHVATDTSSHTTHCYTAHKQDDLRRHLCINLLRQSSIYLPKALAAAVTEVIYLYPHQWQAKLQLTRRSIPHSLEPRFPPASSTRRSTTNTRSGAPESH
jgi:hypothetical protein